MMARSTVHYADNATNNILKKLHNKLRPAGTPVQRVEYIIELLLLRIFEAKLKHDPEFAELRPLFRGESENQLFSSLFAVPNEQLLPTLNSRFFPFYARILSEARKVVAGNPSIKVQDQLVLIEEVFSNSNFTNNVNSGNLQEVISLVGELDEERLLKTDLLGDAIESALSETGGTKDIGLYRTPDLRKCFLAEFAGVCSSDIYPYSVISDKITQQYLAMVLASQHFADMTVQFHERAGMPKINRDQLATIAVTVPSIEVQEESVKRYQREKNLLDELRRTIFDAQGSITSRINKIWEH